MSAEEHASPATPAPSAPEQQGQQDQQEEVSISKIQSLLKAKDDTSRFVGLALLKSVLDNSSDLRGDGAAITTLWESISPKFLDRLLRTGSGLGQGASRPDARSMLDLAVAVIHTFVSLLPEDARTEPRMVGRVRDLVPCLVNSSDETTQLILEVLLSLASQPEGAAEIIRVEDLSPLTEVAPSRPLGLEVLSYAWMNAKARTGFSYDKNVVMKLNKTVENLVSSFRGADVAPLLGFITNLLQDVEIQVLLPNPRWLEPIIGLVRNLFQAESIRDVFIDPATAARCAPYTNLVATLLQVYPSQTPQIIFANDGDAEKPFPYLFITLLLVDLRASFPTMLEQLNAPSYAETSRRLASAFDTLSSFVGYLVRSMDDDAAPLVMAPDLLLRIRRTISETLSVTMQYLRDRWDASVAGAMGLHPDARTGKANTAAGSHLTVAWDSMRDNVSEDALVLAAVRALAIWLREDGNETLCREASGLMDMFVELYQASSAAHAHAQGKLDFRPPVLVALEGILRDEEGVDDFLGNGGWQALEKDMLAILQSGSSSSAGAAVADESEASRGIEIVHILLPIAQAVRPGTREEWMDMVTRVAAWAVPDEEQPAVVLEFQLAVLELVAVLLQNMPPGVRRRYVHSASAIKGIANQLGGKVGEDEALRDSLADILATLSVVS